MKNVESMLKKYRENKAMLRCRELEIEGIESFIKNGGWASESKNEAIESISLEVHVSETPRSVTNKFNSIVENTLLGYENDIDMIPPSMSELRSRIRNLNQSLIPLRLDTKLVVEVLLPCLNAKEKFITECLYIDGYSWNEIVPMYAEKFEIREERTLKDIRKFAIKKMIGVISNIA